MGPGYYWSSEEDLDGHLINHKESKIIVFHQQKICFNIPYERISGIEYIDWDTKRPWKELSLEEMEDLQVKQFEFSFDDRWGPVIKIIPRFKLGREYRIWIKENILSNYYGGR